MTVTTKRGTVLTANGVGTWSNNANAVDGSPGADSQTFAQYASATINGIGGAYLETYGFSPTIPVDAIISAVDLKLRSYFGITSDSTRLPTRQLKVYDGATQIGSNYNITPIVGTPGSIITVSLTTLPTAAQLRSSTFKILANLTHDSSSFGANWFLDYIDAVVTWAVASQDSAGILVG